MDIFKLIGIIYLAKDEDDINKITAVSGSAPAYFYYFIESMLKVAISDFNFSELEAKNIILQVAKGSIALIEQNKEIPIDTLRQNVTSKGGTTQMAIAELINNGFAQIIQKAMHACYKKAEELSLDQ